MICDGMMVLSSVWISDFSFVNMLLVCLWLYIGMLVSCVLVENVISVFVSCVSVVYRCFGGWFGWVLNSCNCGQVVWM